MSEKDIVKNEITFVMNLGNYQTAKITAGFESSVRDGESEEDAFRRVEELVDNRVGELSKKISGKFESKG